MNDNTYVLDISKWRCGGDVLGDHKLGLGSTQMLNEEGYMCCLGQCAAQQGVPESILLNCADPSDISRCLQKAKKKIVYDQNMIHPMRCPPTLTKGKVYYKNSSFANDAMRINDHPKLTTKMRVEKLQALFEKHGFKLEINDPKKQLT